MDDFWLSILGLTVLLAFAVSLLPAANRLNIPYTVLLAVLGCVIGAIQVSIDTTDNLGVIGDFFIALRSFEITSEVIFFLFLPALIFESALAIDVRRLIDDIAPILLLAVIGLLISTFFVGYALWAVSDAALVACLLLGAIVSATDPVAVVAIFKDLGAPKRLAILVEGESLFNDATAIVLFTILAAMMVSDSEPNIALGIWSFFKVFVGGVLVGYILAYVFCQVISRLRDLPLVEISLTISLAYLAFVIAEHYLHVSGVMAVVTAALTVGSLGRTALSADAWKLLRETWEQLGFWANSLIFVFVGIIVSTVLLKAGMQELWWLVVLVVSAFVARALILYGLLPIINYIGLAERVSSTYRTVMFWGGLRGAVSLALALAVIENPNLDEEVQAFIGVLVTGFVLFTLFVNATTMKPMLRMLGLDKLSPSDVAVRDRAVALSLERIAATIGMVSAEHQIDKDISQTVVADYASRAEGRKASLSDLNETVSREDWLQVGLVALANREQESYISYHASGYVSPSIVRLLLENSEDLLDGIKAGNIDGYSAAVDRSLGFGWRFKLGLWLMRYLGWESYLRRCLVDRFEMLIAVVAALIRELNHGLPKVQEVIGNDVSESLEQILRQRLGKTNDSLNALQLQYPEYSKSLQQCHLERIAIRLEDSHYRTMYEQSVLSKEVYADLCIDVKNRAIEIEKLPPLDLGLKPEDMISKVSFFGELNKDQLYQVSQLLKPRLVVPGESIVRKGEKGDSMFFITSGAVEVFLKDNVVRLGSGDFFGEIALIHDQPRVADVQAQTFCDLLSLSVKDFRTLLDANGELKRAILSLAEERLKELVS